MRTYQKSGFSLVEVLLVVVLVAVVGTVGIQLLGNVRSETVEVKLASDISGINRAVDVYLSNGGSFSSLATPQRVLDNLKTAASSADKIHVGFAGTSIDPQLEAVMQSAAESSSDAPRAVWNPTKQNFELRTVGIGVKEFALNPALATALLELEDRDTSVSYASNDSWVWDFQEGTIGSVAGPVTNPVTVVPPTTPTVDPRTMQPLAPPVFSIETQTRIFEDFPLMLEFTNPNPAGTSVVMYTVNGGPWQQYTSAISVQPDQEITAFTLSEIPDTWFDSFSLSHEYSLQLQNFSGVATGGWINPQGAEEMQTSIENNPDSRSDFYYGTPAFDDANHLFFAGSTFDNVMPDSLFELGVLDYYNGTIFGGTGANEVTLSLDLNFFTPNVAENFEFTLELESTPNFDIDADQDADFVRMGNISSEFETILNGVRYALSLQFGFFGDDGFATVDQFHVHENAEASATIYGMFIEAPL